MRAFYNDTSTSRWLSELIRAGEIMSGTVISASISEIKPGDLVGYSRVHLFAGIGGWDLELSMAGWPDDVPVWTGSCPCQPFSTAGKQKWIEDERHLWPEMRRLIRERGPAVVFGEQVASRAGRQWIAGVRDDLEALGYAVGAADLCAAGEGSPHIRQRLYWGAVRLGDSDSNGRDRSRVLLQQGGQGKEGVSATRAGCAISASAWEDCRAIVGADGKARRIEPGIEPLAHGIPAGLVPSGAAGVSRYVAATQQARKQRVAGYGNAIVPQVAATFVRAFMEAVCQM